MMKSGVAALAIVLCLQGAFASRSLSQLPVLGASATAVPAPAPSPSAGGCAVSALQDSGNFNLLLDLIGASSTPDAFTDLLSSDSQFATVFAPTDDGITKTLTTLGLTEDALVANPGLITSILQYHVLPSQLKPSDLVNGYSFNTLYTNQSQPTSVSVNGTGVTATIVGAGSSAPIISYLQVCQFSVFPVDGVLLPTAS